MDGQLVHSKRQQMGAELAREHPVDADLVIGIPDSSTAAAIGYALESGIPFSEGLIKNRYVGRTFIEPEQKLRDLGVRQKFNCLGDVIRGKAHSGGRRQHRSRHDDSACGRTTATGLAQQKST